MRNSVPFLAIAGLACVLAIASPSGARPHVAPTPTPTPTAAPTDTPTATPTDTSSPSAEPSPTASPSPSPSASPSPSVTPYVRRYFNGRPIDTPPPTPTGSLTPTPIPTTTPYVRRYFNGRPIDTPPPTPTASLTPTPIPTTTPYVRRYFQGRLIDTPPPTLTPPGLTSPSPSPSPSPLAPATTIPHRVQPTPLVGTDELLGDWDCTTFGGTSLTHEFSRADDAVSLEVTTTIVLPNGKTAMLHESYKHNPNTHVWTAVLAGGLIFAKGSDWTGDTWTLVGQTRESGAPIRFRMIFTALGTDAYRRDFQRLDGAAWATYAGETCRRTQL